MLCLFLLLARVLCLKFTVFIGDLEGLCLKGLTSSLLAPNLIFKRKKGSGTWEGGRGGGREEGRAITCRPSTCSRDSMVKRSEAASPLISKEMRNAAALAPRNPETNQWQNHSKQQLNEVVYGCLFLFYANKKKNSPLINKTKKNLTTICFFSKPGYNSDLRISCTTPPMYFFIYI